MDSMDFHSLSRRELQSLCKKNKIPANMTNIAMADALTSLTNVIGIEEIGQSDSTMPETPLTSRRTTVRKAANKPQAFESESTQTLTRPRRATAKKVIKEDDLSETTSVNETPAPKTGRRRVTGTSVCRKLDEQTQEVKEENKEERPVVHGYSTRRSSRLQSGQKVTESVQKRGGRKTEAVMIGVLSEEETDDVPMKSNADAIDEVQMNQGDNVKVLSPIPDAAPEDLISEDGSSSTMVSADVSSYIEEVSSANQDIISESKDGFSAQQSSEQQDMSTEVSSYFNDAHVSEISVSELNLISESKNVITLEDDAPADQAMSPEVSNVASDEFDNMDVKEESAVEVVTVASPNVSTQKIAQMPEASPLKEKTNDLVKTNEDKMVESIDSMVEDEVDYGLISFEDDFCDIESEGPKSQMRTSDQVNDMTIEDKMVESNERQEVKNTDDSGLMKFSFENELSDMEDKMVFDFEDMKETVDNISSNLKRSNQVEAPLECEKLDGNEMQGYLTTDLPVMNLTDATVSSPSEVAFKDNQVKSDVAVSFEQLENLKVGSVKCDPIANEEDFKVDSLLDDVSTEEEDSNNESDDDDESDGNDDESVDNDDESVDDDELDDSDQTVEEDESDDNVDEIHESPIAALVKSQNPVTPLKSSSVKKTATSLLKIQNPVTPVKASSAKKTATPNSKLMIKVLEDTEESNKSGKVTLKSNSKLPTSGVAEEKENSDNNKGESTAQKTLKNKSMRSLKKMMKELTITNDKKKKEKSMGMGALQVEKRSPLQMLNDNCLLGEDEK